MNNLESILESIRQKYTVEFEPIHEDDKGNACLEVLSVTNMQQHIDGLVARKAIDNPLKDLPLWAKVWPASFVLGRYLHTCQPEGKSLLELGAGCGITACLVARTGFASICVSDIVNDALLFAKANVLHNKLDHIVRVQRVDIKNSRASLAGERFDIIAASEILYLEDLHRPLLKCLQRHLAFGGKAVLCTDAARFRPRFFKQASKYFTVGVHKVNVQSTDNEAQDEKRAYILCILEHL